MLVKPPRDSLKTCPGHSPAPPPQPCQTHPRARLRLPRPAHLRGPPHSPAFPSLGRRRRQSGPGFRMARGWPGWRTALPRVTIARVLPVLPTGGPGCRALPQFVREPVRQGVQRCLRLSGIREIGKAAGLGVERAPIGVEPLVLNREGPLTMTRTRLEWLKEGGRAGDA